MRSTTDIQDDAPPTSWPANRRRGAAQPPGPFPEDYAHVQPQAVEFEQAVLGALMIEKDAYYQVSEILKPESFYDPRHRTIYEAIRKLAKED